MRAGRNKTLSCLPAEEELFKAELRQIQSITTLECLNNKIINQDFFEALPYFPPNIVDLLILDPPYNLYKNYHGRKFRVQLASEYGLWFNRVLHLLLPVLKPEASIYVCSDWQTSTIIYPYLYEKFQVQNRITWERDKGRGSKKNWKNNAEDIWFCTMSNDYYFNVEAVKLKKRVLAPYRTSQGLPKDWKTSEDGKFRLTYPSNIWTDLTIPFWSMPENTAHPTQKPEKLMAKLILASSKPGDLVFDPFMGSGTSLVVSKKLGRNFIGLEQSTTYCCLGMKRLEQAVTKPLIQGYAEGCFWERNSSIDQRHSAKIGS